MQSVFYCFYYGTRTITKRYLFSFLFLLSWVPVIVDSIVKSDLKISSLLLQSSGGGEI